MRTGSTDGDGLLRERVPAGIAEAELEIDGSPNPDTLAKLEEEHGC